MMTIGRLFTIAAAVVICAACEQQYEGPYVASLDDSTGKWGYADTLGRMLIPPQWDGAKDFSEEMAAVAINGKWGFIDKAGNEKIAMQYDRAEPFAKGLAEVELDGKFAGIDTAGVVVTPFQHNELKYLMEPWGLFYIELQSPPEAVKKLKNSISLQGVSKISIEDMEVLTATFGKDHSFQSNIEVLPMLEGLMKDLLKESKLSAINKDNHWECENFVMGKQTDDENHIFTCDLILSPSHKDAVYKLTLDHKDRMSIVFSESFYIFGHQAKYGSNEGDFIMPLEGTFHFLRLSAFPRLPR
jgi:hypothetical protein